MTDALTDVLNSIRMHGAVFSRAALSAPWGVESGTLHTGVFHAVVDGEAWVRHADGARPVRLERGDVVLLPFGDNHLMTDDPRTPAKPIGLLTSVDERGMGHLVVDGGGEATSLICGTVTFADDLDRSVLAMLPPLILVRGREGALAGEIATLITMIASEVDNPAPGSETVVARLSDALVVHVLRSHVASLPKAETGWLAALRQPGLRDALGAIHRHPDHRWSARELAAKAGMSRSTFFARFRDTVGESPSEYATRWRMNLAARMLRDEGRSVAHTARRVGYATEAAFSDAFKRHMGLRPGAYRRST